MRIRKIRVRNLRAARDCAITLDSLTALVGPNGSGKSTLLHALLIFRGDRAVTAEDFYNKDVRRPIEIAVTFGGLSRRASKKFARYLQDGELEVVRICRWGGGGPESTLHGSVPRNPDFVAVLDAARAEDARPVYDRLRKSPRYGGLAAWSGAEAAERALLRWEDEHPDDCERRLDSGRFFGFGGASDGDLNKFVKILYVPAVQDALQYGTEAGGTSALREMLDLTTRSVAAGSRYYMDLQSSADAVYEDARKVGSTKKMRRLRDDISATLESFARGAGIDLVWDIQKPEVPLPTATVRIVEDGYSSTIDRTGHGLQRAFIVAMLGSWSRVQANAGLRAPVQDSERPSVVLAIEEPELYQHPARARHLARLLQSASRDGLDRVAPSVQVVYTTHSPHFVDAGRIGQVRLLRKVGAAGGGPRTARVWSTSAAAVERRLAAAGALKGADREGIPLELELDLAMTPAVNEGFFAETVVLVEGESDRIAVTEAAAILGRPLDDAGVAVIPCGSKMSMLRPLAMFTELGMRVYVVWDGDLDNAAEQSRNRRILSMLGHDAAGGDWLGRVTPKFACHRRGLEGVLGSDMGEELYDSLVDSYRRRYSLKPGQKKPLLTHLLMREIKQRGIRPATLGRIVRAILGDPAGGFDRA